MGVYREVGIDSLVSATCQLTLLGCSYTLLSMLTHIYDSNETKSDFCIARVVRTN